MIKVRVFRAIDDINSSKTYIEGHVKVLEDYGVTMITSNKPTWYLNPCVYCVVATLESTGEMCGGIRLHVADGNTPLPVEEAIGKMDQGIYDLVKKYFDNGVGELCGLWNSKDVSGVGVSFVLTRAAISLISQLNFQTLMGICADYTLKMFSDVGFIIDRSLGNNGEFPYPTDEYKTKVLGIMNAKTLETAKEYDREKMLDLRKNKIQIREEDGKKGKFLVNYNMVYNGK